MDSVIDWGRYSADSVSQIAWHECESIVENRNGLWLWKGNTLIGRIVPNAHRGLTSEIMRAELADLQHRINQAVSRNAA
jgi:hypothetical protein